MNETFDIKRFGKLLQYEVVNYIPNFFKSLLIFASVIAADRKSTRLNSSHLN